MSWGVARGNRHSRPRLQPEGCYLPLGARAAWLGYRDSLSSSICPLQHLGCPPLLHALCPQGAPQRGGATWRARPVPWSQGSRPFSELPNSSEGTDAADGADGSLAASQTTFQVPAKYFQQHFNSHLFTVFAPSAPQWDGISGRRAALQ